MYERLLVPLDGSKLAEQVLPYARLIAKAMHLRLHLLRVVEPTATLLDNELHPSMRRHDPADHLKGLAQEYLDKVAAGLKEEDLLAKALVREGNAASEILADADQEPGTLIAMSTHGRSGLARWAFGSVTDKVLHGTKNPMLIVRSQGDEALRSEAGFEELIVPLDGSALAESVLPQVVSLAKSLGQRVTLLRVTTPPATYGSNAMEFPTSVYYTLLDGLEDEAREYLAGVAERLRHEGVTSVETTVLTGPPAGVLVEEFAKKSSNALVAMSTHGRSGVGRWVLGSVTDRVLRHSGHPVLVIQSGSK